MSFSEGDMLEDVSVQEWYELFALMLKHTYLRDELYTGKNIDQREIEAIFALSFFELEEVEDIIFREKPFEAIENIYQLFNRSTRPLRRLFETLIISKVKSEIASLQPQLDFLCNLDKEDSYTEEVQEFVMCNADDDVVIDKEMAAKLIFGNLITALRSDVQKILWMAKEFNKGQTPVIWDIAWAEGPKAFSDKVQGSVNRAKIVEMIRVKGEETEAFKQKVEWTKDWILDENTTDEQLEDFLFVVTGAKCNYHKGLEFESVSTVLPMFRFHDCFGRIDVSNSFIPGHCDTKEKHYAMLDDVRNIKGYDMA